MFSKGFIVFAYPSTKTIELDITKKALVWVELDMKMVALVRVELDITEVTLVTIVRRQKMSR